MCIKIYTGSYDTCKFGNLISISGDRGKQVNFNGKTLSCLAPKREFWRIWHDNIGKITEEENMRYYIKQYYEQVLLNVNFEEILFHEKEPILLCYEESDKFCHRHIVAEYLEIKYGIFVPEVSITTTLEVCNKERPKEIRIILESII